MNKSRCDPEIAQGCTCRHIPEHPVPRLMLRPKQNKKFTKSWKKSEKRTKTNFFSFILTVASCRRETRDRALTNFLRAQKKRNNKSILQKRVNKKTWSVLVVAVDTFFSAKERMSQRRKRRKRVFSFDDPQIRVDELILFVSG